MRFMARAERNDAMKSSIERTMFYIVLLVAAVVTIGLVAAWFDFGPVVHSHMGV